MLRQRAAERETTMTKQRKLTSWGHSWDEYSAELEHDADFEVSDVPLDVTAAFGEHDIEYWVNNGSQLVPATADEIAAIMALKRRHAAQMELWQSKHEQQQHISRSPLNPLALLGKLLLVLLRRVPKPAPQFVGEAVEAADDVPSLGSQMAEQQNTR